MRVEGGGFNVFPITAAAETLSTPLPIPVLQLVEREQFATIKTLEVTYECVNVTDIVGPISLLFHTYVYHLAGDKEDHIVNIVLYHPESYYSNSIVNTCEPPELWNKPSFSEGTPVRLSLTCNLSNGYYDPSPSPLIIIAPYYSPIIRFISVIRFEVNGLVHILVTRHILKLGEMSRDLEPAAWLQLREKVIWGDKMYEEPAYFPVKLAELINGSTDSVVVDFYKDMIQNEMQEPWEQYEENCRQCGAHDIEVIEKAKLRLTSLWDRLLQSILAYHFS